ncbi:MAG: helicase HerA-like domain-containing protein [Pseudomonadota bacterium]
MTQPLPVAKHADLELSLLPALANRHGLITGATGTGKTVTLQRLTEQFSAIGVPVFLADVKGDLSGLGAAGAASDKLQKRLDALGVTDWTPRANPVVFWDVFGTAGHPVRATVSDMGPLLLARLLGLNDTQEGVLQIAFRVADDAGLLLLDLKDLRALVQHVGDNAGELKTQYGNISAASIGAIQRGLLTLEAQGGDRFFGEPMLDIADLMQTQDGKGVVNILAADQLMNAPKLYATFLLWLLAELFEQLPEAGDLDKPKLVFFFDEAHLLFTDAPAALIDKVEQVVRLIRSKGVGVYFVTQNPLDVPDKVLGQLGNRVQHALRAFTPRDQKAVKAAAETMRANPAFDAVAAITELGVGEALVSFLDEKGRPAVVERAFVLAPGSRIGPLTDAERQQAIRASVLHGHYEKAVDRESAYEKLTARVAEASGKVSPGGAATQNAGSEGGGLNELLFGRTGPRGGQYDGLVQTMAKTVVRTIGSQVGRQIVRGVLGSLLGGRR